MNSKKKNKPSIAPWERQDGEPDKAFYFFNLYKNMGAEGTLQKVADATGKTLHSMGLYSAKWKWIERKRAYIDELERRKTIANAKAIEDMQRRHTSSSMAGIAALMTPVKFLLSKVDEMQKNGEKPDISLENLIYASTNAMRVLNSLTDIERKSRGEATEISKTDITSGGKVIAILPPCAPPPDLYNARADDDMTEEVANGDSTE